MTVHNTDFPFSEIRDDGTENGDYFHTVADAKKAGHAEENIWAVLMDDDDDSITYGPSHHWINKLGYVATREAHDGNTYYVERWED